MAGPHCGIAGSKGEVTRYRCSGGSAGKSIISSPAPRHPYLVTRISSRVSRHPREKVAMDFSLNEEQRGWQLKAREFALEEVRPVSLKLDQVPDPRETFDW